MNDETIAEMVQNWINGTWMSGLVHPSAAQLVELIKGREEWIKREFEWRDRLIDKHLESLKAAEAKAKAAAIQDARTIDRLKHELAATTIRAEAAEGEASSAMETTKLTQEKLHDALNSIQGLTRERDEALDIAERTHTDMHAVRSELERQRQRADAVEWEADGQCGHCGEDAVRVSIDTAGYPHEVYAVRYCPVCHSAWVREEPVNPDASQM